MTATQDWREEKISLLKKIIKKSAPALTEDSKWGAAVWVGKKNVISVGMMKEHVKINFFFGATLSDPQKIFNNGLESKNSRSVDFFKDSEINEVALKEIIKQAAEQDQN